MKRAVSLWLPVFATDRLSRVLSRTGSTRTADAKSAGTPLATVTQVHGGTRIAAANPAAEAAGIVPGQPLADARALYPGLAVHPAAPAEDLRALDLLAGACTRFTPWTAVDPVWGGGAMGGSLGAGLWLDITGCAHLFGGEAALLERLIGWLGRQNISARAGLADTPGAAWALARHATNDSAPFIIAEPGTLRRHLAGLPVAALRLEAAVIEGLDRLGLRRIGDLLEMPRGPLAKRFGGVVLKRLDQALGQADEPISPRRPPPRHVARLAFAEPIGRAEDIAAGLDRLLDRLCRGLEAAGEGARQLDFILYRADGTTERRTVGTSRPSRDPRHLARLFRDKLDGADPGFGIEIMALAAARTNNLDEKQTELPGWTLEPAKDVNQADTARLVDRLSGKLGARNVTRVRPVESHLPERAGRAQSAISASNTASDWKGPERRPPRPVELLPQPLPIDVMAPVPDGPPVMFRWRRRQYQVARAEGPERIAPEWWRTEGAPLSRDVRDYYRLEDEGGKRYWVYREGLYRPDRPPAWYLHGFFA